MKAEYYPYALAALLLGLLLPTRATYAQSMYQVDPFAAAAAPFDQLNPAALTTGLLAERGNPFMSLYSYTLGLPHHDSLTLSADGLQMAAVTAQTMAYNPANAAWLGADRYTGRRRTHSDTVYLGALLVRHDQLASDALSANLVSLNTTAGKVYDVPGRPRSPYVVQTAVLMAPLTESLTGPHATFYLDSRDLLANVPGAQAVGLRVNGQYFSFGINTSRSYTFPSSGTYAVSLQFLVGGSYKWAHANVVVPPPAPQQLQLTGGPFFTVPIDGGGGTLRIQYSGHCGERLSKTIIFVGGLDPENDRGYDDVTRPKLEYLVPIIGTAYDNKTVLTHLDDANFDIIFVDWDDGAASLGTNAAVVARAIQTINRLKTGDGDGTPSIIVGQSMGGLCVRAGIHMLDSAQIDPRLERFYSWDTPHRGANYPISMQSLIVYFGDNDILRNNVDGIKRAYLAHLADGPRQLRLLSVDIQGNRSTLEFDAWQAY